MPTHGRRLTKAGKANRKKDLRIMQNNLRIARGKKPILKKERQSGKTLSVEYAGKPFPVGFNSIQSLKKTERYSGRADKVMLVWNKNQIVPAEQYRKAHFSNLKVDIVVCEDPNAQLSQIGKERALIYHFQ
ncbi:MAG: hypothetical protein Q7S21_06910 [archaeon]|nr:hypothetical protein [archaeon]